MLVEAAMHICAALVAGLAQIKSHPLWAVQTLIPLACSQSQPVYVFLWFPSPRTSQSPTITRAMLKSEASIQQHLSGQSLPTMGYWPQKSQPIL